MDAVKYVKELSRKTGHEMSDEMAKTLVENIEQWSSEHPQETMLEHFKKMFPNAPAINEAILFICPYRLGWCEKSVCAEMASCADCWNQPYVEVEK
jgi:hypothetical protein